MPALQRPDEISTRSSQRLHPSKTLQLALKRHYPPRFSGARSRRFLRFRPHAYAWPEVPTNGGGASRGGSCRLYLLGRPVGILPVSRQEVERVAGGGAPVAGGCLHTRRAPFGATSDRGNPVGVQLVCD